MAFYQFKSKSLIKADISEVWDFIFVATELKENNTRIYGFCSYQQNG